MLAQILSGAVLGVDAFLVHVEVDLARGLPCMNVVGLPESAVREGRERVTAALANSGHPLPPRRITVNLAPADVRKDGSAFDLPIAVGLLAAAGTLPARRAAGLAFIGELGLDGELRPVRGVLPVAVRCASEGLAGLVVPWANAAEAAVVEGLAVYGARTLTEVARHLSGARVLPRYASPAAVEEGEVPDLDLSDVRGQESAKRALEVAAAGQHNLLMIGAPGAGKSMLARRLPGILPPLTRAEAVEVTRVYSVTGRLRPGQALLPARPFRAPHHTISDAGLIGGGGVLLRPGEISLAHHGVLFLDELPEFRRPVLESLRQPLEDGCIQIGRARASLSYPARFMLVAAMNPCPCGYRHTEDGRCVCSDRQADTYAARVSGPLLDRIDLHIDVPPLEEHELSMLPAGESSAVVRARVIAARERQVARFRTTQPAIFANAQMPPRVLREHCRLPADGEILMRNALRQMGVSARGFHRVLRLARTIADLAAAPAIERAHLAEAIQYRSLMRAGAAPRLAR